MLIGRLTRDPEPIQMSGATAGAKWGFAVNNSKYNQQTQQWEQIPVFIDCETWNRGESKQADRVLNTLRKGQQVYLEGHLKLETWDDKNGGGKRTALRLVVEMFQYLEPKAEGVAPSSGQRQQQPARTNGSGPRGGYGYGRTGYDDPDPGDEPGNGARGGYGGNRGGDEDIPF